ncbi:MAG: glycosyltransferase [Proteobacteria bacterium]|nr:glycosyltransferase [Pseudomonadota bacterium]
MIQKPLTVLQVLPALEIGGVERGAVELAVYLKNQGHCSLVLSAGGKMVSQLEQNAVEHICLPVGKKSLTTLAYVFTLKKIFRSRKVDIVHARSRLPAWLCYCAIKLMKSNKPKFITTLHGLHSVKKYSSIMARGDQVIAVSNAASDYLKNHFSSYLKNEPVTIYRGIDPAEFPYGFLPDNSWLSNWYSKYPQAKNKKLIMLAGRLTALKGVENLLEWLNKTKIESILLLTSRPDKSHYTRRIWTLFDQQGLGDRIIWLGEQTDIKLYYGLVDLLVSVNNKAESFGRTVLEALSIGTAVVAYDKGGVTEIMQQIFPAGLVEADNKNALTLKIDDLLGNRHTVPQTHHFLQANMFSQTEQLYLSVMKDER